MSRADPPAVGTGKPAPWYARYVATMEGRDVQRVLRGQGTRLRAACAGLSDADALHRYAPEKWSVKEVIGHIGDTERVMAYRALRFGRGDSTMLPGFDQNAYVREAGFDARPLGDLLDEFDVVRAATVALFASFTPEQLDRWGVANGTEMSVRILSGIIPGHAEHHLGILRDRYGLGVPAM
ncbi:MAG TPA: DinB family protein [Longimicrobiaceae bacterium]|nr:DinB family protein [Longimicrobiaceae bacterium]